jgi:Transposase zinc-ribbon domain
VHYPRFVGEFQAWFRTDADCLGYLEWVRWPRGFVCPDCGRGGGWRLGDGRIMCAACGRRTSVTAGTIFDRTRTPLTVWFAACWSFGTAKDGISALGLQKALEIGSLQTAWAMLHRLRSVLVRPGRELLAGAVGGRDLHLGHVQAGISLFGYSR